MPLLDHFYPPLATRRHWESFHAAWATEVMAYLNRQILPEGYFAEAQVHVGSRVEIDVATFEERAESANGTGEVALATWAPPMTALVMPAIFPDELEVQIYSIRGGPNLVGAVEFVSPGNKDRPEARRAFAAKCAGYLQLGIGLVVVDIVTERQANLHAELLDLMKMSSMYGFLTDPMLYAVAYRPSRKTTGDQIEVWPYPLTLGADLPTVGLALRDGPTVPLDLELTYQQVCEDCRLT